MHPPRWPAFAVLLALTVPVVAQPPTPEPLHRRIDAMLEASYVAPPAGRASDATLVRRLYLDLTGRGPSMEETRNFLEDSSPDKWSQLVDQLLTDPRFVKHMANYLDVALMERRADKHVKRDQWRPFLEEAVRQNVAYHELASQILGADGRDPANRGPAKFYLEREAEPNRLTRDIGRVFFGVDLQCAQCHDHPLIDDYYQADYYGIYAFVSRLSMFADKGKKISYLSEKFDGDVNFKSVFTDESGKTNPRLLWDGELGADPVFPKGQEYKVKPDKNAAGVPKYSRRNRLAEEVAKGENVAFRRNIANRLWAFMMGRGLVHPVDLHHSGNPAAHPELLEMLASEFAAGGFDMRAFLKEIAITKAYCRDFALPSDWHAQREKVAAARGDWEKSLASATQTLEQATQRFGESSEKYSAASAPMKEAEAALAPLAAEEAKLKAAYETAAAALAESKKLQRASEEKVAPLNDGLRAARSAQEKLGASSPKELAEAVAVLQAKADAAGKELKAKSDVVTKMQAAADAAAAPYKQAQEKSGPARKKVESLAGAVAEAEAAYRTEEASVKQAQREVDKWRLKLAESETLLAAAQQVAEAGKARAAFTAAQQTAAPVAKRRDPLVAQLRTTESAVKTLNEQLTKAESEKTSVEQQLAAAAESTTLLGAASQLLAKVEGGVKNELAETQKTIDGRRAVLASQQAELEASAAKASEEMAALTADRDRLSAERKALEDSLAELDSEWKPLEAALAEAAAQLTSAEAPLDSAVESVREQWSHRFAMTGLKALTPEQLCWSILEATGQTRVQRASAAAALDKKSPLSEADKKNPEKVAAREAQIDTDTYNKLNANVAAFVKLFAAAAGQPQGEFFATADQALFFRNGSPIRGWIGSGGDSLYQRLTKIEDPAQLADDLYIGILSRSPETDERDDVVGYL